jgi:hypothetical protein
MATAYGLDGRVSIHGKGKYFSFLHGIQTGSGVHPTTYPVDSEGSLRGSKAARA